MRAYKRWTDAELQYIKDNISQYNDKNLGIKLAQMTGETISTSMIRRQRRKLGVVKLRGRPKKVVESLSSNANDNKVSQWVESER